MPEPAAADYSGGGFVFGLMRVSALVLILTEQHARKIKARRPAEIRAAVRAVIAVIIVTTEEIVAIAAHDHLARVATVTVLAHRPLDVAHVRVAARILITLLLIALLPTPRRPLLAPFRAVGLPLRLELL